MKTEIFKITDENASSVISCCAEILKKGELVAFPTETVYGLGGNGLLASAAKKIYEAKGRPSDNPLILHIGRIEDLDPLVTGIPEKAQKLIDAFWPGPLTLIFNKADCVPAETSGGLDTIAVRFPVHPVANALLKACDFPVAAPSANLSGRPSTTRGSHVIEDLDGRVAGILDGGDVPIGVESTIVDVTRETPVLLRYGYITVEEMEKVIGPMEIDPAIRSENIISHSIEVDHPKAPGMKYRHYAPKAPVTVVYGDEWEVVRCIDAHSDENTGILTVDEHLTGYHTGKVYSVGSLKAPDRIIHELFDVLRRFDAAGVEKIYAEDLTGADTTGAVMNRLLKSAGGTFVKYSEL